MGWLCSACGTENRFRETRCRACLSKGSLKSRVTGLGITLYEQLSANRLGTFAETAWDKVIRYVGSANRAAGIGIAIGTVCAAVMLLIMCAGILRSGIPAQRIDQLSERLVQCVENSGEVLVLRAQQLAQRGVEWKQPMQRLAQRGEALLQSGAETAECLAQNSELAAEYIDENLAEMDQLIRSADSRWKTFWRMTFSKLPKFDMYIVVWLINRLHDLSSWIYAENIGWLEGVAEWLPAIGEELQKLLRMLQQLRS